MAPDSLVQGHVLLRHSLVIFWAIKHQQVYLRPVAGLKAPGIRN